MQNQDAILMFIGAAIGLFVLYTLLKRSSPYTAESFDNMTIQQATEKFVSQTAEIANNMKNEIKNAIDDGKSKDDLINISDKYSDFSADLNKRYARFHIMNMPTPPKSMIQSPAPGPTSVTQPVPVTTQGPPMRSRDQGVARPVPVTTQGSPMRSMDQGVIRPSPTPAGFR